MRAAMTVLAAALLALAAAPVAAFDSAETLARIEARIGHPLNAEQRKKYAHAAQLAAKDMRAFQGQFIRRLAEATGLDVDEVARLVPKLGEAQVPAERDLEAKLAARLRRPLDAGERATLRAAEEERRRGFQPIEERFASSVGRLTGLGPDAVRGLMAD
jgi:hypothetical protein